MPTPMMKALMRHGNRKASMCESVLAAMHSPISPGRLSPPAMVINSWRVKWEIEASEISLFMILLWFVVLVYDHNVKRGGFVYSDDILNTPQDVSGRIRGHFDENPTKTSAGPQWIGARVSCSEQISDYLAAGVSVAAAGVSVMPSSFFTSGAMSVSEASSK